MIPNMESCSQLFSMIINWILQAMESSATTSRRNSESPIGFDMEELNGPLFLVLLIKFTRFLMLKHFIGTQQVSSTVRTIGQKSS